MEELFCSKIFIVTPVMRSESQTGWVYPEAEQYFNLNFRELTNTTAHACQMANAHVKEVVWSIDKRDHSMPKELQ